MYYATVALLMFLLPLVSIVIDGAAQSHGISGISAELIGKWYVFWAVGLRLLLAGMRQVIQPRFTARIILGIQGDEALLLVRELGFANLAFGIIGVISLIAPSWRMPAALAGGVFYGLAGVTHALQPHRNRLEMVAMGSDLFAALLLLGSFAAMLPD